MTSEDQTNCATVENHPRKDDDFLRRLQNLPNLFSQDCVKKEKKARLRTTLRAIEEEQQRRDEDFQNPENPKNLVTFLKWTLGDVPEAEAMAAREVQERPSNILALSNSAYVLWQKGETGQAWGRLEKLEALRDGDQQLYDDLEMEAQYDILYLYIRLGHLFRPYEISKLQEKLLLRRPHDDSLKYTLGLTLRRYTDQFWTSMHPDVDFVPAARRAMELFVQIKDREENRPDLRARAAAELGVILGRQREERIRNAVKDEQRRLGLTADRCFDEALGLAENNPAVLVCAGKYFRQQNKLTKSRELLEKAVNLHPVPKAHHQLGITLRQLALQEKGPGHAGAHQGYSRNQGSYPRTQGNQRDRRQQGFNPQAAAATVKTPRLRRDGRYVQEAIEHFRKFLELSYWENDLALYDLGMMYFYIGEYDLALQQFHKILELLLLNSIVFNKAREQAGLVLAEMADGESNGERREAFDEMSQFCLNLTLSNQCWMLLRKLRTTRINEAFWRSFYSLQQALRHQRFKEQWENTEKDEGLLLTTAKDYSETLPVLRGLFTYSEREAEDASVLERAARGYITDGRYGDALLFLSLLKLTQQRHVLATWRDADVYVRVHVLVAQDRLLRCVGRNDVLTDLNVTAAKLMFRQAFEDVFSPAGNSTTPPSQAAPTPGETLADVSSPELEDDGSEALNVLLLHDPRDKEAERDAKNLQAVLQEICGLKTALKCDEEPLGAGRSALANTATNAELLVFVVRSGDVSPEFSAWLKEAVNTTTAGAVGLSHTPDPPSSSHRLVTLVLNSSPLPPALQGHRSFSACSSELLEMSQGQGSRSEVGVRAACKLFCGLIGLQM